MIDPECRAALKSIASQLEALLKQVNEATIVGHSIRMAIDEVDKPMTVRIRKQYLRLETASTQPMREAVAGLRQIVAKLEISQKDMN